MRKCVLRHMRTTKVQISLRIRLFALSKVSRFYLASVTEQPGLNLTWSKIPEDTFSRDEAHKASNKANGPGHSKIE